jgi:hypothetical protein
LGCSSVVECMLSMNQALDSILSKTKDKIKKKNGLNLEVHICNLNIQEAETGTLQIWIHSGIPRDILCYKKERWYSSKCSQRTVRPQHTASDHDFLCSKTQGLFSCSSIFWVIGSVWHEWKIFYSSHISVGVILPSRGQQQFVEILGYSYYNLLWSMRRGQGCC